MKKITAFLFLISCITAVFLFSGCVKDTCRQSHHYTFFEPVYKTTAEVRANIKSNPAKPVQHPGKIFIKGNYIFLNEMDRGIHVIDNTNPSQPKNIAFIDIPGNIDMAVKGNTLYADLYTDLITLDITNPASVVTKKIIEGAFPYRSYSGGFVMDRTKLIVDWVKKDTTVVENCRDGNLLWARSDVLFMSASGDASKSAASSPFGMGGSMARFTIVNDRLYTVTTTDMNVFNISSLSNPAFTNKINVGFQVETIYPFKNNLFIGSTSGMFVYNIIDPDKPVQSGQFGHVRSCDPVIADDDYAYVTLRSGTRCQGFTNELDILQLNTLSDPKLIAVYPLNNPQGLSKDGNTLFICDGTDGLKIFDAGSVQQLKLLKQISGMDAYDVIAWNKVALVSAKDGLYQYDYSNLGDIRLLSKMQINY